MASVDMCEHDWPGSGCPECKALAAPSPAGGAVDNLSDKHLRWIADSKDAGTCRARIRAALSIVEALANPSPAGGVREALARRLYIAHTHATNRGPDRIDLSDVDLNEWFDNLAKMPLSGQSFVALWNAMADAALSSPATPEPVSAPAGEVVAWMWKHEDGTLSFVSDPDTKRIWEETMKRVLVPVYAHPTGEKEGRS